MIKHNLQQHEVDATHMLADLLTDWQNHKVTKDDTYVWDLYRAQHPDTWVGLIDCAGHMMDAGYIHPMMGMVKVKQLCAALYNRLMSNQWDYVMSPRYAGRSHHIKTQVWSTVRSICELTEQALMQTRGQYHNLFDEEDDNDKDE